MLGRNDLLDGLSLLAGGNATLAVTVLNLFCGLLSVIEMLCDSTDPCGSLLLVFVHVDVQAGGEEVQLGSESLVHRYHLILLFGQ